MKIAVSSLAAALTLAVLGSGCALQPVTTAEETIPAAEAAAEAEVPTTFAKQPESPFPIDTLYSLLAAEIAGSRQAYDIALSNYAQQARETRDPAIAERATLIARYLNNLEVAAEVASIWVDAQPENVEALTNAAVALMQNNQLFDAFEMSRRLQALGRETLFQSIAASAGNLSEAERQELLNIYEQQLVLTPDDEQLLVGTGLLLQLNGATDDALVLARRALKHHPQSAGAGLLEANLLQQLGQDEEALARMAKLLEYHPDNQRLRLQYARILTRHNLTLAQREFALLAEQSGDPDLRLSLGLVAMETGDLDTASQAFEQLLDSNQHVSSAHFYIAQIAEQQEDIPRAIMHYLQVDPGRDLMPANQRLLTLLVGRGDLDSARAHITRLGQEAPELWEPLEQLLAQSFIHYGHLDAAQQQLDTALSKSPDSHPLLLSRALLHERRGQLAQAEQDLRNIIARDPNNSAALNALGYILTDHNIRLDEARELLLKAIALSPDEPAIIDSLGWLYFRTGNYPEALIYLRRAYSSYPVAEVAAHLGEVLWVIGEQQQARKIWRESLESEPESEILLKTLQRLGVDPL